MNAKVRRSAILARLKHENGPVSATALAKEHGVSRQIIVGDIALLRAGGEPISATPRGYLLDRENAGELHTVAVRHTTQEMERELQICVDNGCTVLDVIVEHPVYGQLTAPLALSSRYDVEQFIHRMKTSHAQPISALTGGVHLHTLSCPSEAVFAHLKETLADMGMLYDAN